MADRLDRAVEVGAHFAKMSPEAQRVMEVLVELPGRMADPRVRREIRGFLERCRLAGISVEEVERALVVVANFDGVFGGDEGEHVRLVEIG